MDNMLIQKAKELLANGETDLLIGYGKGTHTPRPLFVTTKEDAEKLIFDEHCTGNLSVYLTHKDLIGGKKVTLLASYYALKSICQLDKENQIDKDSLKIFGGVDNDLKQFESIDEIKEYLKTAPTPAKPEVDKLIEQIDAMTPTERWEYWTSELSKCFKCYACRAACPMCYCAKCIVETNRPQWIEPWAATLTNMEWQINRVMHLAGRCVGCGACGAACPLGLPIFTITRKMGKLVKEHFGTQDGKGNVLSTFKPEDKENFIL